MRHAAALLSYRYTGETRQTWIRPNHHCHSMATFPIPVSTISLKCQVWKRSSICSICFSLSQPIKYGVKQLNLSTYSTHGRGGGQEIFEARGKGGSRYQLGRFFVPARHHMYCMWSSLPCNIYLVLHKQHVHVAHTKSFQPPKELFYQVLPEKNSQLTHKSIINHWWIL